MGGNEGADIGAGVDGDDLSGNDNVAIWGKIGVWKIRSSASPATTTATTIAAAAVAAAGS